MSLGVLQSSNVCLINELPEPKQTLLEKIIMLFSLFEIATVNDTYIASHGVGEQRAILQWQI
jgi:hypothetical protein